MYQKIAEYAIVSADLRIQKAHIMFHASLKQLVNIAEGDSSRKKFKMENIFLKTFTDDDPAKSPSGG